MALKALRPWERVVAVAGDLSTDWKQEDARLAIETGKRLAYGKDVSFVVITTDADFVEGLVDPDEVEVIRTSDARKTTLEMVTFSDLVVVAAHGIQSATGIWSWKVTRTFKDVSVAMVAGPYRLSVASGSINERGARSFVGPHTDTL
jgi:hypothetical protein